MEYKSVTYNWGALYSELNDMAVLSFASAAAS
jgi:hypothetical protein